MNRSRQRWWYELRAVLGPWATTRAIVFGALGATHQIRDHAAAIGRPIDTVGLFGWDAAFYRDIARHGYDATLTLHAGAGRRFFPLYPLLAHLLGGSDLVLVAITSVATLGFLVLLRHLALAWTDARAAERVVWLAAVAPGVLATVLPYAEGLYVLLGAATLYLLLVRRRPELAAVCAYGAALTRPVGVLLAVVFVVDAIERRSWRSALGTLGAPLGLVTYLVWTGNLDPLREQSQENLRGKTVDPVRALWHAVHDAAAQHRVGPALHVAWAFVAIGACALAWKRLPRAATAYSVVTILVALSSYNLDSFERYALTAFPLLVAIASLRSHRDVDRAVLVTLGAALATYSVLAFTVTSIP